MAKIIGFDPTEIRPLAGWSVRERAELDQMRIALGPVLPVLEWSEGVTDAGEPWLVAVDAATDELAVHLARIGRDYVVLDGRLTPVASGRSLKTVIDSCAEFCRGAAVGLGEVWRPARSGPAPHLQGQGPEGMPLAPGTADPEDRALTGTAARPEERSGETGAGAAPNDPWRQADAASGARAADPAPAEATPDQLAPPPAAGDIADRPAALDPTARPTAPTPAGPPAPAGPTPDDAGGPDALAAVPQTAMATVLVLPLAAAAHRRGEDAPDGAADPVPAEGTAADGATVLRFPGRDPAKDVVGPSGTGTAPETGPDAGPFEPSLGLPDGIVLPTAQGGGWAELLESLRHDSRGSDAATIDAFLFDETARADILDIDRPLPGAYPVGDGADRTGGSATDAAELPLVGSRTEAGDTSDATEIADLDGFLFG